MSFETLIDSSEIFKIDQDIISFKMKSNNLNTSSDPIAADEIYLNITNLTNNYLAFRTKTTKKSIYAVDPPYYIIPPNETKKLKIIFFNVPGEKLDPKGHKFRFEGFTILESEKNLYPKDLFTKYINEGKKIVGNIKKRSVKFIYENEDDNINNKEKKEENNIIEEDMQKLKKEEIISKEDIFEEDNNNNEMEEKNISEEKLEKKIDIEGEKNKKNMIIYLYIGLFIISALITFYLKK